MDHKTLRSTARLATTRSKDRRDGERCRCVMYTASHSIDEEARFSLLSENQKSRVCNTRMEKILPMMTAAATINT